MRHFRARLVSMSMRTDPQAMTDGSNFGCGRLEKRCSALSLSGYGK
jgi:hypothetical protein